MMIPCLTNLFIILFMIGTLLIVAYVLGWAVEWVFRKLHAWWVAYSSGLGD